MIDIHTHLLNNVDDGSRDETESLGLIKLAEEAGFTDIILTPHYIESYYENDYESTKPKIEELKLKLISENITVKLHHGNEVYVSDNIRNLLETKTVASLAGSQYLLFELPLKSRILTLDNVIMDIQLAGYIPVLAHPERYLFIQEDPNKIIDIISKGVLIQCNYGSIVGQYGKEAQKTIIKLLKHNMVHLLASDTHRHGFIYENFNKIEKELLKCVDSNVLMRLTTTNAEKILNNDKIRVNEPVRIKKGLFFK